MEVKSEDQRSDNALWDSYIALLPDESQGVSGQRVGRDQSWFSRRETERKAGAVKLKPRDRRAIERAIDVLTAETPESRARREAYAQAAADAQAMADRYKALATSPPVGAVRTRERVGSTREPPGKGGPHRTEKPKRRRAK